MGFVRINDAEPQQRVETPVEKVLTTVREYATGTETFFILKGVVTHAPRQTVGDISKCFYSANVSSVSSYPEATFENADFDAYFSWERVDGKSEYLLSGYIKRKPKTSPVPSQA